MLGVDDIADLCADAITRQPGDAVPQPLFEAVAVEGAPPATAVVEVARRFHITDWGDVEIVVRPGRTVSFAQGVARVVLGVVAAAITFASVLVSLGGGHGVDNQPDWKAAAILLWVAVGLCIVNLALGEVTVKRGRT